MSIGFVMIVSPWSSWSEGRCRRRQCEGSAGEEEEECHCCWRVDHWRVTELTLFPFPDQVKVELGSHLFSDKEEAAATYLGMTESLYGHLRPSTWWGCTWARESATNEMLPLFLTTVTWVYTKRWPWARQFWTYAYWSIQEKPPQTPAPNGMN